MLLDRNWFQVGLTLRGDELDVEAATAALGLSPARWGRKGEHLHQREGESSRPLLRTPKCTTNYWHHDATQDDSVPFEEQIAPVLSHLEARPDAVRLLRRPGVVSEWYLGFASYSPMGQTVWFSPALLARIGALGIELAMDLFPPSATLALRKYERSVAVRRG